MIVIPKNAEAGQGVNLDSVQNMYCYSQSSNLAGITVYQIVFAGEHRTWIWNYSTPEERDLAWADILSSSAVRVCGPEPLPPSP